MELINLMVKYYMNTIVRSFKLAIKNWSVSLMLIVYSTVLIIASVVIQGLPLIGGMILAALTAACTGSYLFIIEMIINTRVVRINDIKNSFLPYLRRIINITFYLWIAMIIYTFIVQRVLQSFSYGWIINTVIFFTAFILLNPLPEFIYQTSVFELGIFKASANFVIENFIEWVIPNAVLLGLLYFLFNSSFMVFQSFNVVYILKYLIGLFIFLFTMVYRGILFRFLNESTRRSRLFKLRMLNLK